MDKLPLQSTNYAHGGGRALNQYPHLSVFKRLNHWRINKFRQFRVYRTLKWLGWRYERSRTHYPLEELPQCKSIGLMMLGTGIGDAIVLSGFIHALREAGRNVHLICNQRTAVVFESMIESDGIHVLPDKPTREDALALHLAFDVLVLFSDPDKNLYRAAAVMTAIDHKYIIGFNQRYNAFFDLNIKRDELGCHWSERLKDGAACLGVEIKDYRYALHFTPDCLAEVRAFTQRLNGRGFVVFNPAASDKFRSLSLQAVRQILSWLAAHSHLQVVVYNVFDAVMVRDFPGVIFNPFEQIDRCIALLEHAAFLISVDTSFVHAGRFFDVPMLGIYNNRLVCGKYDNNVMWGPNYAKARQVFSTDHINTESGDDLRLMPFAVLEQALKQTEELK